MTTTQTPKLERIAAGIYKMGEYSIVSRGRSSYDVKIGHTVNSVAVNRVSNLKEAEAWITYIYQNRSEFGYTSKATPTEKPEVTQALAAMRMRRRMQTM